MDSPALSVCSEFSDMSDEELDKYFASYVPLSNLPTPPPAKEQPAVAVSTAPPECQSSKVQAYAVHLANLVPRNVAPQKPAVSTISEYLEKANLPIEIIAFAACILDALSQRFASSWRDASLSPSESSFSFCSATHLRYQSTLCPDLVVLSALALAHGFVDDRGRSNGHWARVEARSQFTARDVERTKMCILRDIDYGLFRISEGMVHRQMREMQRACASHKQPLSLSAPPVTSLTRKDSVAASAAEKEERRPKLALSTGTAGTAGTAIWANGMQTPEPSP